jgi:hypothetical protein
MDDGILTLVWLGPAAQWALEDNKDNNTNNPAYQGFLCLLMVALVANYLMTIVCGLLIQRFVKRHYAGPSEALWRNLNHQMNLNLFIQVLIEYIYCRILRLYICSRLSELTFLLSTNDY